MLVIKLYFKNGTYAEYKDCQMLESLSNYVIGRPQDNKLEFIPKDRVDNTLSFYVEDK